MLSFEITVLTGVVATKRTTPQKLLQVTTTMPLAIVIWAGGHLTGPVCPRSLEISCLFCSVRPAEGHSGVSKDTDFARMPPFKSL